MSTTGRNAEHAPLKDSGFVRCARCGFVCHKDRDSRAPEGSRRGEGISYRQVYLQTTIVNGVVTSIVTTT